MLANRAAILMIWVILILDRRLALLVISSPSELRPK